MVSDQRLQQDYRNREKEFGEQAPLKMRNVSEIPSKWFIFEAVVREDKCVVVHLRNLHHNFRNKNVMDRLVKYISDRVGQHRSIYADFIGELSVGGRKGGVMAINSLDIFIYDYLPAKMHDEKFVGDHLSKIGQQLIEQLNVSL